MSLASCLPASLRTTRTALVTAALLASGLLAAQPAHAQLIGQPVNGSLTFNGSFNAFDPANGFVPADTLNASGTTVTISGSQVEFGFQSTNNRDTADFTASQLIITDNALTSGLNSPFTMTFTSAAFSGLTLTKVSDSFYGGGLTGSLLGTTLTVSSAGGDAVGGTTYQGVFNLTPAATVVPEPGEWAVMGMLGTSVCGLMIRARRKASTSKKVTATA